MRVVFLVLLLPIALVSYLLVASRFIFPIHPINNHQCVSITGFSGLEDGHIYHNDDGRRYIVLSSDSRESLGATHPPKVADRIALAKHQGNVVIIERDLEDENQTKLIQCELRGYTDPDFHPHGLHIRNKQLYIINHRRTGDHVEVFSLTSLSPSSCIIDHVDSVTSPLFRSLNDVVSVDENSFFVSLDNYYRDEGIERLVELSTRRPWAGVGLCTKQTKEWECKQVVDNLIYSNGVAVSESRKYFYVSQVTAKVISVYSIATPNHDLTHLFDIQLDFFPDNIDVVEGRDDQIVTGGHPSTLAFVLHALSEKQKRKAGSIVAKIDLNYKDRTSKVEVLFEDDGSVISASSFGIVEVNEKTKQKQVVVGAVFWDGVAVCPIGTQEKGAKHAEKKKEEL